MLAQGTQRPIGLIHHNYLVSDLKLFKKSHIFVVYVIVVSVVNKRVGPRVTKSHWVNPLFFVLHIKNVGDIFMLVKYCF